eukprot:9403998-Karenia_brevis.AAC.1
MAALKLITSLWVAIDTTGVLANLPLGASLDLTSLKSGGAWLAPGSCKVFCDFKSFKIAQPCASKSTGVSWPAVA